jgi:hypothetical protein
MKKYSISLASKIPSIPVKITIITNTTTNIGEDAGEKGRLIHCW